MFSLSKILRLSRNFKSPRTWKGNQTRIVNKNISLPSEVWPKLGRNVSNLREQFVHSFRSVLPHYSIRNKGKTVKKRRKQTNLLRGSPIILNLFPIDRLFFWSYALQSKAEESRIERVGKQRRNDSVYLSGWILNYSFDHALLTMLFALSQQHNLCWKSLAKMILTQLNAS